MRAAPEIAQIRPDLWFWQTYDPAVKCDLSSCAVRTQKGELVEGEPWLDGLTPIAIPGAPSGEIAIHCATGTLVIGDALIHFPPHGFALLPDKYCADPPALRIALRKLLRFDFEVLTFAHGFPLVARARQRLEALIA
jgi:hypothetical protein